MASPASERRRVRALIQRAGVTMLVTIDEQAVPTSRPMLPIFLDHDPSIYFLTHQHSRKVRQIAARSQVGLTLSTAGCYFVVAGTAEALRDPELIRRLWHPTYRAWFPDGKDDRDATALRVRVDRVDYWEPPRTRLRRVAQAVKAVVTRRAINTPMKTITGPLDTEVR
jgi:general stress protein 26